MIVYLITNKINGKQYVGQTTQKLSDRWKFHCSKASRCMAMKSAIDKYGKENFSIEILYEASSLEDLNKKEEEYINEFDSLAPNGYNLTTGGNRSIFSEESRKKMSTSQLGRTPWNKGLTKDDPRVASYVRTGEDHYLYGKPGLHTGKKHSEKTKSRMSEVKVGTSYKKGKVKFGVICKETGKFYKSVQIASENLGITAKSIYNSLHGQRSTNGYSFYKSVL